MLVTYQRGLALPSETWSATAASMELAESAGKLTRAATKKLQHSHNKAIRSNLQSAQTTANAKRISLSHCTQLTKLALSTLFPDLTLSTLFSHLALSTLFSDLELATTLFLDLELVALFSDLALATLRPHAQPTWLFSDLALSTLS